MKAQYICNCINYHQLFDDATEMAQAVENAERVLKRDFYDMVNIISPHKRIKQVGYSQFKNLLILYDITKDIHYFYL